MVNQSNRSFQTPVKNAETFKKITHLEPDLLQCLIQGPKDGCTNSDQALSMQFLSPEKTRIANAMLDMIWKNHDEWVDLMCHFLWIRSPAVEFTLQGARDDYRQFFDLFASNPTVGLTPTPDIELVWLTHQLSPSSFSMFSKTSVGRLVEHNVVPHDPDHIQALVSTERAFRARYGAAYRRCLCWDCQNLQRIARRTLSDNRDIHHFVQESMREVAQHRAVERTRRSHRNLPISYQ